MKPTGTEVLKMHDERFSSGFYERYMSGYGLDIGFRGMAMDPNAVPVLPTATGIDLDYPGYNGQSLPFDSESQDYVHASHVLEHIQNYWGALQEWFRVLKVGGHLVIFVPHVYLYEKAFVVGGKWGACQDHKRTYSPADLLQEIEGSLAPNSYRIVHMRDNDKNFDYSKGPEMHPDFFNECFEIECVLKKIKKPTWDVL